MLFHQYRFRFNLPGTLLAIAGIALFASLGVWQSYRAIEKQELQQAYDSIHSQPAVALRELLQNDPQLQDKNSRFRGVHVSGHYDATHELLIDNIVVDGSAGYYVMTPLLLDDGRVIMVNRGWLPVGRDRSQLPDLNTPQQAVSIKGQLAPPRSKPPLILGELPLTDKLWPYFDMQAYAQHTGYRLLPLIILLDENADNGFTRHWPKYESRVGMHIGYAIQWFVFALIVLATYLGLNIRKKDNKEPTQQQK